MERNFEAAISRIYSEISEVEKLIDRLVKENEELRRKHEGPITASSSEPRPAMTIGNLIDLLTNAPSEEYPDPLVRFDFPGEFYPDRIGSYRGSYVYPALSYSEKEIMVSELLKELKTAILFSHSGWKGGEYYFNLNSELFIAKRGESTNIIPVGIIDERFQIIIETRYQP